MTEFSVVKYVRTNYAVGPGDEPRRMETVAVFQTEGEAVAHAEKMHYESAAAFQYEAERDRKEPTYVYHFDVEEVAA